ncbi:hypothetical protein [Vulgatibacter incomptus]|uniref:Cell division protein FtsK n=1 Tax=Vulgatibacter incomptus TaxID=1391653 RepID=A0A0K1P8Y7_9BACT|nr:hypothetical protein [Vulgatibacter incomptus]AKU89972.1 Cell division protein FtsK [Vulgatibacter incomptus]
MSVRSFSIAWVILALATAGCGGCRSKEAAQEATAAAFLPARPSSAILVPDPAKLGETVKALEQTRLAGLAATTVLGARDAGDLLRPITRQLGFDPREPGGFEKTGIDGRKGIAFGDDVLVIGVTDRDRFDPYVAALAKRLGGETRGKETWTGTQEAPANVEVTTFTDASGKVQVALGVKDGFAVIGSGGSAVEKVGASLSRPRSLSLDANPAFRKLLGRLGERDVYGWLPEGMGAGRNRRLEKGAAFGLRAGTGGLNARVIASQGALQLAMILPIGKQAGAGLVPLLPPDDLLVVRLGGDPVALSPVLDSLLPRGLSRALVAAGIDPTTEILSQLQPGIALGLELNPAIDLSGGIPTDPSISSTNPFRFVRAMMVARVKDPAKAAEVLGKLATGAERFRMQIASEEKDGVKIYRATYAAGEGMTWGLVGDTLLATGGGEEMFQKGLARVRARDEITGSRGADGGADKKKSGSARRAAEEVGPASAGPISSNALRASSSGAEKAAGAAKAENVAARADGKADGFAIAEPGARQLFDSAGSAAHLDVARLAASLRAIPQSAFGVGGFRMKELFQTWVDLLDEVKGVTAALSIDEDGVIVDMDVGLK